MTKKRKWISFRSVLMVLTVVLVGWVIYQNWPDMIDTFEHLGEANWLVLILLIPEQLFMYFACGQIFFSYLRNRRNVKKFTGGEIMRISTELNFVNHAVPAGGIGGLAFLTYRLGQYGVSAGQASFLYLFRYAVTTVINYAQALVLVAKMLNSLVRIVTFGRKKQLMRYKWISGYFADIHDSVKMAKDNKRYLKRPAMWGVIYSLCEVGTYWIVAWSLGRPELLPIIMVGEAIGSVFDGIVPYGLYELGMAGVMIALGVDFPTATIVTVMTRVMTLVFTIASGSYPYYKAIRGKQNDR